jgi:hypothetical protein
MVSGEISEWSLVRTGDGYYGIVTSVRERYVFLANGCEQKLDQDEWNDLEHLPLNIFQGEGSAGASFSGIERSSLFDQEPGRVTP